MFAHALLLTACLLAAQDKTADDAKKELGRLEGTWTCASFEFQGMQAPDNVLKSVGFTFKGDQYDFKGGDGNDEKGTVKLDPTKKPKSLDFQITEGTDKGKLQLAIYELEGDTLKICAALPGAKDRPKEFSTTKAEGGQALVVFKRAKKDK